MYNIISQLCTDSGVTLGMTQAQIEALPNGDRTGINIYGSKGKKAEFANDITTNRDLLFWIAQTLGCFATMNRAGQLEFRPYTQNVVDVISNNHRIEGATFADYVTHYIGIYVENLDDNTEDYYGYDTTALTAELNETSAEISADNEDITELQADLVTWQQKYENHECTEQEYLAAVAEINADIAAKRNDIKQLNKRLAWLENALQSGGDDGSDMVLGANPLCMAKSKTTRDQQRREIHLRGHHHHLRLLPRQRTGHENLDLRRPRYWHRHRSRRFGNPDTTIHARQGEIERQRNRSWAGHLQDIAREHARLSGHQIRQRKGQYVHRHREQCQIFRTAN